jgi:hypothetical protein
MRGAPLLVTGKVGFRVRWARKQMLEGKDFPLRKKISRSCNG